MLARGRRLCAHNAPRVQPLGPLLVSLPDTGAGAAPAGSAAAAGAGAGDGPLAASHVAAGALNFWKARPGCSVVRARCGEIVD
jgi:hypothetical protein